MIYIRFEDCLACRIDADCRISDQNRHPLFQKYTRRRLRGDDAVDLFPVPSGILHQQQFCQAKRLRRSDAAGAEGAGLAVEQIAMIGVVQKHEMRIGENEFHPAQCIVRTCGLPDHIREALQILPVDGPGVDFPALKIKQQITLLLQIVRILAQLGQNDALDDARRYRPGRVEFYIFNFILEHRCLGKGFAYLDLRLPDPPAILHQKSPEPGNVDQQIVLAQFVHDPCVIAPD